MNSKIVIDQMIKPILLTELWGGAPAAATSSSSSGGSYSTPNWSNKK